MITKKVNKHLLEMLVVRTISPLLQRSQTIRLIAFSICCLHSMSFGPIAFQGNHNRPGFSSSLSSTNFHSHGILQPPQEDELEQAEKIVNSSRRQACTSVIASLAGILGSSSIMPSYAAVAAPGDATTALTAGMEGKNGHVLESRVTQNILSMPTFGMEGTDVFYPNWFAGVWNVESISTDVEAPCGIALFGGNRTFATALSEVGKTNALRYQSRFIPVPSSTDNQQQGFDAPVAVIADREYNVKSISQAAMGANSVMDMIQVTPNKISCVLAPQGSPSLLRVDLFTLNRFQEAVSENRFDCSEVVREIVSPLGDNISNGQSLSSPLQQQTPSNNKIT